MSLEIKEIQYENYGKCLSITNGVIKVIVTIDVGPRIISFGFIDGENILYNDLSRIYKYDNEKIRSFYGKNSVCYKYGGHKFLTIPELMPESYYPDNSPVVYSVQSDSISFMQPVQDENNIKLTLEIMMYEDAKDIMVIHSLLNTSDNSMLVGLSGSTDLSGNGLLVIPQNPPGENVYAPNCSYALWPFSKMSDKRVFFGDKYITIKHDPNNSNKFKLGTNNYSNWAAYLKNDIAFVKHYVHNKKARYPDFNSSFEVYTDENIVEIKTISPMYNVEPDSIIRHVENWSIENYKTSIDPKDEDQLDNFVSSI